jgi:hypothetical protein
MTAAALKALSAELAAQADDIDLVEKQDRAHAEAINRLDEKLSSYVIESAEFQEGVTRTLGLHGAILARQESLLEKVLKRLNELGG